MDFIKSLRSGSTSNQSKINSQKNLKKRPPINKQTSFKDRFNEIKFPISNRTQSSTEKIKALRTENRRNQRFNMVNDRRIINTSAFKNDETIDATTDSNLQSTFLIPENLSPRKKKLALWRSQREQQRSSKKLENRPIWKVHHVDPKIFEKPKTMTKSYSFADRTINRSNIGYRQNSTLLTRPTKKNEIQYFGSMNCQDTKFTFTASVETFQEFVKRRESSPKKKIEKDNQITRVPPKINKSEFENILNTLNPEERNFFNQTMEGRNKIISSSNLTQIIDGKNDSPILASSVKPKTQDETSIIKEEEKRMISKSIERITKDITENLSINKADLKSLSGLNKNNKSEKSSEKYNTPIKASFITSRIDSPPIISEKIIISPIKSYMTEKIELDANRNYKESVLYYRKLVDDKTTYLNDLSKKWNIICKETISPPLSDDHQGSISYAVGVANLLIDQRFSQFKDLIFKCEETNEKYLRDELDEKLVKPSDLQGFWEMINHQVVDVEKNFFELSKLKDNNWVEIVETPPKLDIAKPKSKIDPLKKFRKPNEVEQPKSKPKGPVKSKFAEFKAKMVAEKAAKEKKCTNENILKIQTNENSNTDNHLSKESEETNEKDELIVNKTGALFISNVSIKEEKRKSSKLDINSDNIISKETKPNVRSRRSDLIKFESPAATNSPRRKVTKGIFTLPNFESTIVESNEIESAKTVEQAICFDFDDDYEPMVFGKAKKNDKISNKENNLPKITLIKQSSKENNQLLSLGCSPKTPQNIRQRDLNFNSNEITKSNPNHMKCISNSPLLKLAMISSHGKRQSLSTGKNIRYNTGNDSENTINFG